MKNRKPACTKGAHHICFQYQHVGGPVIDCQQSKVLICRKPAAVVGDALHCNGARDKISGGSSKVKICGINAVRMNDPCQHGGYLQTGEGKVLLG